MNGMTERGLNDMISFLQEEERRRGKKLSVDEAKELMRQFFAKQLGLVAATAGTAKDAYDFLELAGAAQSKNTALKYLEKARALEPDNLDVLLAFAKVEAEGHPAVLLGKMESLLEKGKRDLEKEGLYEECIGDFWDVYETRPYMRVMKTYMDTMVEYGMLKKSATVGEELLRLSSLDNLGVRYALMVLYMLLEDEEHMERVLGRFSDEAERCVQFLLPHAMLRFKRGDFAEAERLVKQLQKVNRNFKKFLRMILEDRLEEICTNDIAYHPGTIEEFAIELEENPRLMMGSMAFFEWAKEVLKPGRRKAKK